VLEKHGYAHPGAFRDPAANRELLLLCGRKAAQGGSDALVGLLLDVGVVPDFWMMHHVARRASTPTLRRCAAVCEAHVASYGEGQYDKPQLDTQAAHALREGLLVNFLCLVNEVKSGLPPGFGPAVDGFVGLVERKEVRDKRRQDMAPNELAASPSEAGEVEEEDDGALIDAALEAVVRLWSDPSDRAAVIDRLRFLTDLNKEGLEKGLGVDRSSSYTHAIALLLIKKTFQYHRRTGGG